MPVELNFNERRVLGVLIEKGFTTPEQYPLSLNSLVVGSNQKSCRDPMAFLDEEKALDSLESLQQKGFVTCVRMVGSRVDRWKHRFGETLALDAKEVAILAELFLRGPQTDGELRQRASRMRPIESLEEVESLIEGLRSRPEPLVERLGPPGRRRGVKYAHTFYPPGERPSDDGGAGEYEASAAAEALAEEPAARTGPAAGSPSTAGAAPLRAALTPPRPAAGPAGAGAAGAGVAGASAGANAGRTAAGSTGGVAGGAAAPAAVAVGAANGALLELREEIEKLQDRVAELEATFVKFLR